MQVTERCSFFEQKKADLKMGPPEGGVRRFSALVCYIAISISGLFDVKLRDSRHLQADVPEELRIIC
jgi:hypothetical protein